MINECKEFVSLLKTNHHNSVQCCLIKDRYVKNRASRNLGQVCSFFEKELDNYISLNGFKSDERYRNNLKEINAIYFDLDYHPDEDDFDALFADGEYNWTEQLVERTEQLLLENLPVKPTMIVRTGRGLGVYYVFKDSIACTAKTLKMRRFVDFIWRSIGKQIKELLDDNVSTFNSFGLPDLLSLDQCVIGDYSRLVRVSGTKNTAAGVYAAISYRGNLVHLKELANTIPEYLKYIEWRKEHGPKDFVKSNKKRKKKKNKSREFCKDKQSLCRIRLQMLEELQKSTDSHVGRHHNMVFLYYNHASQIYDTTVAQSMTLKFNSQFVDYQESVNSIESMFRSVNRTSNKSGKGFYLFSNKSIAEMLGLDNEEEMIYFPKVTYREAKAKIKKEKKEERNEEIRLCILERRLTYKEIAVKYGVSESTVFRIAKKNGIKRGLNWMSESEYSDSAYFTEREETSETITENTSSCDAKKLRMADVLPFDIKGFLMKFNQNGFPVWCRKTTKNGISQNVPLKKVIHIRGRTKEININLITINKDLCI